MAASSERWQLLSTFAQAQDLSESVGAHQGTPRQAGRQNDGIACRPDHERLLCIDAHTPYPRAFAGEPGLSRPTYGRTWWGAQWLHSLADIDHDNRLPRGRTYANRGAVRDLVVTDNRIQARVQGSRPRPYEVDIEVPPIPAADAARLAQRLAKDPGLIARLLNRDLDPVVLKESAALDIKVFPSRWSDLKMHCSCPDWAVPCKHLAAVIYLLSQEIDGDPFLVFRLRKVDLGALLGQHGMAMGAASEEVVPAGVLELFDDPTMAQAAGTDARAAIDFTTLPNLLDALWRLLPAQPTFWRSGDFRETARKAMARIAREAQRQLEAPVVPDEHSPLPDGPLQFVIDDHGTLSPSGVTLADRKIDTLWQALELVTALPPTRLADLPPAFGHLNTLRLMALHLLAQGAVVPRVVAPADKTLGLHWCAAELDTTVRGMVEQLAATLPPGLVLHRQGRKQSPLPAGTQARVLLSALIDALLRRFAESSNESDKAQRSREDGKVRALFFGAGQARLDGPGEGAIAGSIQSWLSRLHLGAQAHRPVLQIDEAKDEQGFALSLAVIDERSRLDAPTRWPRCSRSRHGPRNAWPCSKPSPCWPSSTHR